MSDYAPKGLYPAGVDWHMPIPGGTLTALLDEAVARFANHPAISFLGYKIKYKELGRLVDNAARGLVDMDVEPGDRIGLFMPNSPYYPIMFFAALKAGATVVNFSSAYKDYPEKLEAQIRDSGASLMVTMDLKEFYNSTKDMLDKKVLEDVVYCHMSNVLPAGKSAAFQLFSNKVVKPVNPWDERLQSFDHLVEMGGLADNGALPAIDKNQLAVIQYTSGTTGTAKGAMLSHFNMVANAQQINGMFGQHENRPHAPGLLIPGKEKFLAVLPFYHVYGLTLALDALFNGAELIILPDPRDPGAILETIDSQKPTKFPAVPQIISSLTAYDKAPVMNPYKEPLKFAKYVRESIGARGIEAIPSIKQALTQRRKTFSDYDTSSINAVISGSAALLPHVNENWTRAAGGNQIYQGYGLTECSPVISSNPPTGPNKPQSVGLPLPGTEIRLADPNNPERILATGEKGEIWVRGPQVMQGYLNNREETAKVITPDGWYKTGDIGAFDDDGYLYIVGRMKRMANINGIKVSPEMIEKTISENPQLSQLLAECAVIRQNINTNRESLLAILRFKPGVERPTTDQLKEFLEKSLTSHELPRQFRIVTDPLPKNDMQKPDWKKMEEDEAKAKAPSPQNPTL
jgi:long-chain acyl-CoA synthetase